MKDRTDDVVFRSYYGEDPDDYWLAEVTRLEPWRGEIVLYAMPGRIKIKSEELLLQFDAYPVIHDQDLYFVENWAKGEIERYTW